MATTFKLTLTPEDGGSPITYDAEFPTQVAARVSHIERLDQATIEAALTDGEIGYQIDTSELVGFFNGQHKRGQLSLCPGPVDIGDWDMDAVATITIPNASFPGLTFANFKYAIVVINEDDDEPAYQKYDFLSYGGGTIRIDSSNGDIHLDRWGSGLFDSTNFDKTSYNRGQVFAVYG